MTDKDRLAKLEEKLAQQESEIAALRAKLEPPRPRGPTSGPRDYTEGLSMPRSALKAMVDAVPGVGQIAREQSASLQPRAALNERAVATTGAKGPTGGWVEARPLDPQPGIDRVDELMNEADRRDRLELAKRLGVKP